MMLRKLWVVVREAVNVARAWRRQVAISRRDHSLALRDAKQWEDGDAANDT